MEKTKKTRLRILEVACGLFAEHGYRDTTVQQICDAADANVAAVNYYYGNKAGLYREVWRRAAAMLDEVHGSALPAPSAVEGPEADPEARLRELVRSRVFAIFDDGPGGWFPGLIQKEMAHPSDIAAELQEEFIAPRRRALAGEVAGLLRPKATRIQVQVCTLNVAGLFVFLNIRRARGEQFGQDRPPSETEIETIARQTADFAMAGIRDIRARIH